MKMHLDPMKHWLGQVPQERLEQVVSPVITNWAYIAFMKNRSMKDVINEHYGYPTHEFKGGELLTNGIYKYPEDPDLYPIISYDIGDEVIFYYEHEMLGIYNKVTDERYVTRVD